MAMGVCYGSKLQAISYSLQATRLQHFFGSYDFSMKAGYFNLLMWKI